MTRSNFDLRLWARIGIVAMIATTLGAVIAGPWLGLLMIFAIAMSRRGQLLLFGRHAARPSWQNATSRPYDRDRSRSYGTSKPAR